MTKFSAVVPSTHPAMPGHFPGHPIVPGVVMIDEIIAALRHLHPERMCAGVKKMKFLAPLMPGTSFDIEFGEPSETSIRFAVTGGETKLANGRLALEANSP